MTDLVAALVAAIDRARTARRADFVLVPDAVLPITVQSTPAVPRPPIVVRPQDCDCHASQVAMVAHWERCASRTRGRS